MDPTLLALAFHRASELERYWSFGSNDFVFFIFATRTVQVYNRKRTALVKRQKADDGPVVPVIVPAIVINFLPVVTRKTISEVEGY